MSSNLGVTFKLTPEAVESFRQRRTISTSSPAPFPRHLELVPDDDSLVESSSFSQDDQDVPIRSTELEEWDDVIAIPPTNRNGLEGDDDDDDENHDENHDENEDDQISLSPPISLPIVVVNLERLCGYVPVEQSEVQLLRQQVLDALLRDDYETQDNATLQSPEEAENLSRHFDARVAELFETGMAFHGDTSMDHLFNPQQDDNNNSIGIIPYPEFLCRSDRPEVIVTARQWKRLIRQHPVPVIHRTLQHLARCSRSMTWKIDMHEELCNIARDEQYQRLERQREVEVMQWRTHRRKERLDKLYQVRETFDHKLEVANIKLEHLEADRDAAASNELRRLRVNHGLPGGLETLDFDTNIFAFPTDERQASRVITDNSRRNSSFDDSSTDSGFQNDDLDLLPADDDDDGDDDNVLNLSVREGHNPNGESPVNLPAITDATRAKARRQRAAKKLRRRLESQAHAAQLSLERERIEQAHADEERVRQMFTTPQLRMAQTVVKSLEARMKQVDDLIESLQEEEWADEEDGIEQDNNGETTTATHRPEEHELSLLDQILAMILGSLPQGCHHNTKEHYQFVREEHRIIIEQWMETFGRVPPPLLSSSHGNSEEVVHREVDENLESRVKSMALSQQNHLGMSIPSNKALEMGRGLVEEETYIEDSWEDVDNWDDRMASFPVHSAPSDLNTESSVPSKVVGLRPGAKLSQR